MNEENANKIPQIINFKLMVFIGLILSETQILVNLKEFSNINNFPYFILIYFSLTTTYLVHSFISYAFLLKKEKALTLQFCEHSLIPLSVFFISLLTRVQDLIMVKIIAIFLLILQSLIVILKIIYIGNIISQLAQISSVSKIFRIIKLILIAILPILINSKMVVVITLSLSQLICLIAFCFKFTYQKILYEYILLVGIFCGTISGFQAVFEELFNLPYFFIGEFMSLYFYYQQQSFLKNIVQLKYIHRFSTVVDNKQDQDDLTNFLFINECIFSNKRSIKLSINTQNEGNIQLQQLINGFYNSVDQKQCQNLIQIIKSQSQLKRNLLLIYDKFLQNTESFEALQFLINSALQLQGSFVNKALVIYYNHIERYLLKKSIFEKCKYQLLFNRIRSHIQSKFSDSQQIKYIQFSSNLKELNQQIQKCMQNQIKLFEYLAQSDKNKENTLQDKLTMRNSLKKNIRLIFSQCFRSHFYLTSNQFKFLFILYQITIQKRLFPLKQHLKKYFISSQVQKLSEQDHLKSLVVLSGFNHGEIINSNQNFKNHIATTLNSFGKNNISELIPTDRQRQTHLQLMNEEIQFKIQDQKSHSQYQCWLMLQKQINSIKIKVLQKYIISVRFYYENSKGFQYICSLMQEQSKNQNKGDYYLMKKECDGLISKGVQLNIINQISVNQLGQKLQIYQIQLKNHLNVSIQFLQTKRNLIYNKIHHNTQELINQKTTKIQQQMINAQQIVRPFLNWIQILLILLLMGLLFILLVYISSSIDKLSFIVLHKQTPIQQAELIHSRLMLEQQIISFNVQTSYFPDNICSNFKIPNIYSYIYEKALDDLYNNTDQFFDLLTLPNNYGILDRNLYTNDHQSLPYLKNYQSLISFQKHVQFMKIETFDWLSSLNGSQLNTKFYQYIFPDIMKGSTFDSHGALSGVMDDDKTLYVNDLLQTISIFKTLASIGATLIFLLIIILRIRDNYNLVQYFIAIESIKGEMLRNRINELKSAVNQIHKLNANHIDNVQFNHQFTLSIKFDKIQTSNLPLQNFNQWHTNSQSKNQLQNDGEDQQQASEFSEFIKFRDRDSISFVSRSKLLRVVLYNKIFLIIFIATFLSVIILANIVITMQINRISTISKCDDAKGQFNNIQQKMINIVAYNWLKVLSMHTTFNMNNANLMFQEAIGYFLESQFVKKVQNAYGNDKSYSNFILFDNVCRFFHKEVQCTNYRNGLFTSGFSTLIPFVLKEQLQSDQASLNYTYYISNLCDKTWLLFQGILPMTLQIPKQAYIKLTDEASRGFVVYLLDLVAALILSLILIVIYQQKRLISEKIIRQETLSLETVKNLYSISQFQLYFNQIFYS